MHSLIVGGDSAIGAALATALRAGGHKVSTTTRRRGRDDAIFFDMAMPDLEALPQSDLIVICAAMARFEDCRRQPELARQVNVTTPALIAKKANGQARRVILLSTSAVFDCLTPKRKADDGYSPRSAYGRFKAEAERAVLSQGEGMSVLRLTKIVLEDEGVFAGWIVALKQGRTVTAFDDHALCPLPMAAVVEALTAIVVHGDDGIYQVSGADDVTYADAARMLADELGLPADRVAAASAAASLSVDGITPFTSLDTTRLSALTGFMPPETRDVLRFVYAPSLRQAVSVRR